MQKDEAVRTPSRYMPAYSETLTWKTQFTGSLIVAIFVLLYGYAIWNDPKLGVFLLGIICIVLLVSYFSPDHLESIYEKRKNDDIGTFARLLDYRNIDTWIIRAVYEEVNEELGYGKSLPLRPDSVK